MEFLCTRSLRIQLDQALDAGEIRFNGMTSDEAMSALKKAKDKLELGLMTQVRYDSLKAVYAKLVK